MACLPCASPRALSAMRTAVEPSCCSLQPVLMNGCSGFAAGALLAGATRGGGVTRADFLRHLAQLGLAGSVAGQLSQTHARTSTGELSVGPAALAWLQPSLAPTLS